MSYYSNTLKNQPIINAQDYYVSDEEYSILSAKSAKIQKLQEKITELEEELGKEKEKIILSKYTPAFDSISVYYKRTESYYDWNTGEEVEENNNTSIIEVNTLNTEVDLIMGFDLPKGVVIVGKYRITINSGKRKMKKTFLGLSIFEFKDFYQGCRGMYFEENSTATKNFINNFFDCNYEGNLGLRELSSCFEDNPNFEIIIKEAPKDSVDLLLKNKLVNQPTPMNKALSLTKPAYNKLKEMDLLDDAIKAIVQNSPCSSSRYNYQVYIPENENEFIEALDICKQGGEDLKFYHIIGRRSTLYLDLAEFYRSHEILRENYTFKKFINYVITETVNQGYKNLWNFVSDLTDYLRMCKDCHIKPTLYSSYLRQTHDVASRNYSIILEEKQEEIFKERYKGFKNMKVGEYTVVVPSSSEEVKEEGNNLNHCVASYIKRILDGDCLIFFLRKNEKESLITFEYRHGDVVQVRGSHNRSATPNENTAINQWLKKIKEGK